MACLSALRCFGFALALAFAGCTGTVGGTGVAPDEPSAPPSRPPPRDPPGPGTRPPEPAGKTPTFLTYEPGARKLLQLSQQQLARHLGDVLGTPVDLSAELPPWSAQGGVVPEVLAKALHDYAAKAHPRLISQNKLPFKSCEAAAQPRACLSDAIRKLGLALQRREVTAEALDRYLAVYDAWKDGGDADTASRGLFTSLLLSPATLSQHDRLQAAPSPSRRALFYWDTPSLAAAADPIADARFERHVAKLLQSWLGLDAPETLARTNEDGKAIATALQRQMFADLVREVAIVIRSGGKFADLFRFGKTGLGVLAHPYVMLNHSAANHRSIVFRGLFVYRELLCQTVPFPTADINMQIEDLLQKTKAVTEIDHLQERLARGECRACHQTFDAFGVRLNAFDMLGNLAPQSAQVIDLDAQLPGWREEPRGLRAHGPEELRDSLSQHSLAKGCFARRWLDAMTDRDLGLVPRAEYDRFLAAVLDDQPLAESLRALVEKLAGGSP